MRPGDRRTRASPERTPMPTTKHRYWIIALAVVGLAGLGYTAYTVFRTPGTPGSPGMSQENGGLAKAGAAPAGGPGGPGGAMPVAVEVVRAESRTLSEAASAVGTLLSNESVVLRPEIAGRISAIHFRDGQVVARGAVLLTFDSAVQEAELQQARANLVLAQTNFRRTEDLFQRQFISERARDEAAATLKVQEAAVALAEARLAKTRIRAPFDGVVGIRSISVGDYVKDGQDLINIEDVATLKVDFRLPEVYLPQLRPGQSAEVTSDALPGKVFRAVVDAVNPQVDTGGRSVLVRGHLANFRGNLRPGMFVRVQLAFGERKGVVMVPEQALVPAGGSQSIFRVLAEDGASRAQNVKVAIGQRAQGWVEISEGLAAGELVVTAGQQRLREGATVRVVEGPAPQPLANAAPVGPANGAKAAAGGSKPL